MQDEDDALIEAALRQEFGQGGVRPSQAALPETIGPYKIVRRIGSGGMGVVYEAEQTEPTRRVALKVTRSPAGSSSHHVRLFQREIEVLGRFRHPSIAQIYDARVTKDGQQYFVMELIQGESLVEYCEATELSLRARLTLFARVCGAVHYAHQRGVIHRDLKPANILVDQDGVPHILDFGLARFIDPDMELTRSLLDAHALVGTLPYMSPEQTRTDPISLDIRTDIYSLGVIFFEMLTGNYPYEVVGHMADVLRNIAETEPVRPSSFHRKIDDDVETIVLKALAKEQDRRYQSAEALARDVEHYLNDEPIDAKRDSTWYVIRKSLRRYRVAVGVTAAFVFLLCASTIALSIMYQTQIHARLAEEEQRKVAEQREDEAVAARQVADQARHAESRQRKLAEERESEAVAARAEVQKRADELKTVTEFQQSMLGDVDAELMGIRLKKDLGERLRESLEKRGLDHEQVQVALEGFEESLRSINATDAALKILDENVLVPAAETIEKEFADQPLVRAALQLPVADTYRAIGLYEPAMPLLEAALETRRNELGDEHPDTLILISRMASLLEAAGKYDEALVYGREAVQGHRRVLGDDHPDTLISIGIMGSLHGSIGKFSEAEHYFREAMEGSRRALGDDHPDTLQLISAMGFVLHQTGKLDEAEPYYRESLEASRRVLGDDDQNTLVSISNLGALLQSMGKLDEVMPYYRESLESSRRVLGDDHPFTLLSIGNMGTLLWSMGKLAEAEPYIRETLESNRRVLGDDHPATLHSMYNMSAVLESMGKYEEALSYGRQNLEDMRRVLGDDHPYTLMSISNMGYVLESMGKYDEAMPYFRGALESSRRVLGDDHPDTLSSINNMASLLQSMEKLTEAEPYYREALEGSRRVLGDDHPRTLASIGNMGRLLNQLGRHGDATDLLRAGEPTARRVYVGGNSRWLGNYLARVGEAQTSLGEYKDAETTLLEAHTLLAADFGDNHKRTTKTVEWLVKLFEAWAATEPGKGYAAKADEWRAKLPQPVDEAAAANP